MQGAFRPRFDARRAPVMTGETDAPVRSASASRARGTHHRPDTLRCISKYYDVRLQSAFEGKQQNNQVTHGALHEFGFFTGG